jgi:hypothetical protein
MSDCSCSITMDIDESVQMLSQKKVTAKKAHKCGECNRDISIGETYLKETYVYDGKISMEKTCMDCLSIRDNLFCSWYYQALLETLEAEILEYARMPPEACIAKLTRRARERVCELIERAWENEWEGGE